ncbi:MAG: DNA polymerase/3'-5' exonuclease PolX [Bacteroidota bacterium]|nr:DNA polymerase/3'-5' exonuclease PolX [Bacteroidota bacterium]
MIPELNSELSVIFGSMAAIYDYLGSNERFRALAYKKVSRVLKSLNEDITVFINNNTLDEIPGVGEGIADKIREYVSTGKISKYEELKEKVPFELMEMLNISGFGPESLRQIHKELNINTKEELIKAINNGSIARLRNFGIRKVENMMRGLKLHKKAEERMSLWLALQLSESIAGELKKLKEITQIEVAGSIRRKKESIGDIDILVSCKPENRRKIIKAFISLKICKNVLLKGDTKASIIVKHDDRQIDLRIVEENEWGAALLYFTGSKEHNIFLRSLAKEKGYKINEYGVFNVKDNKRIAGKTETEIYKLLGFQWIPPEMREDKGEYKLAEKNKIPKLVEIDNLKGDMQMHSRWSDGLNSIEELASFVMKNYPYEYIVLTDHSKAERVAGGMDENKFREQNKKIKAINLKLEKEFIKTGAEVDILADGSLDLSNDLLSELDWVCASIHSGFNKDNTERLISACRNPYVCCIGHPTGRLIGKREEYKADWKRIFKVAAETGTAMEINSQPDRMDLNDELSELARQQGVMLTISTDSHSLSDLAFISLGVWIARRAWCTAADILNTAGWETVRKFALKKRDLFTNSN